MNKMYSTCSQCTGTGIERIILHVDGEGVSTEETCRRCGGTGSLVHAWIDPVFMDFIVAVSDNVNALVEKVDDLTDKVDDCLDKLNDINEKIDEL